ncbi:MAG: hypothetical protein ACE5EM_08715 [Sphingomonadales bacterium]
MLSPRKLILLATLGTVLALAVAVVAIYDLIRYDNPTSVETTLPEELSKIAPASGPAENDHSEQPDNEKQRN